MYINLYFINVINAIGNSGIDSDITYWTGDIRAVTVAIRIFFFFWLPKPLSRIHTMPRKKRIVFRDASQRPQQTADGSDDELAGGGTIKAINTWANIEHDEEDQCE